MSLLDGDRRMTMQVIAAAAGFKRDLLIERAQSGLVRVKAAGKALGRPQSPTKAQQEEILVARQQGVSLGLLAGKYGTTRAAIQRVEKRAIAA